MSSDTDIETTEAAEKPKLDLEVQIDEKSACERHVTVKVSEGDIKRYVEEAFDELAPKAEIRGFRPGRAPRKLVEQQFKEQISDKVKGSLLMDAMGQVSEDSEFSAISEPDFDYDAIDVPEEGPLTFEFDIEVRPEFTMPDWKGLTLEHPNHEYTDDEVAERAAQLLQDRYGKTVDVDEIANGDVVGATLTFQHEGETISETTESLVIRPSLSFRDGKLDGFDKLMVGAKVGDTLETQIEISEGTSNDDLRGKKVDAKIAVESIKRRQAPALTPQFLEEIGGFESEDQLHDVIRSEMERQLQYHQDQETRKQITEALTKEADWELPPDLLRRQSRRELERAVLELRSSGFSEDMIQSSANRLQQNVLASTEKALKEHFILERIAEDNELDASEEDFQMEVAQIAMQRNESPRRVRARLEKRGQMDALRNQIIERKAIAVITEAATSKDVPFEAEKPTDEHPCGHFIAGAEEEDIPDAQHGEENALPESPDHT